MTRETKLGLAVGASFLALVSIVIFTALRGRETQQTPAETASPIPITKKSPQFAEQKSPQSLLPAEFQIQPNTPKLKESFQAPALPGASNSGPSFPQLQTAPPAPVVRNELSNPPPPTIPNLSGQVVPPIPPMPGAASSTPSLPPTPVGPKGPDFELPPLPNQEVRKDPGAGAPQGAIPAPAPIDLLSKVQLPADFGVPPSPTPAGPPNPFPPLPSDKLPQGHPNNPGAIPGPVQQPIAPIPGSPIAPPGPAPGAAFPEIGSQGVGALPKNPQIGPQPQGPLVPKAQVESFDERRYVCQATDIDFAAVSKRFYNGTDRYGQALIEFNRDHPIGKASVRLAPRLEPGVVVFVPPVQVLESKYSRFILPQSVNNPKSPNPGVASPPKPLVPVVDAPTPQTSPGTGAPLPGPQTPQQGWGNTAPPTAPPIQPAAPQKQGNGVVAAAAWSNQATDNPPPPNKVYWVPQGGKRLWEIARETLGNSDRWSEIYRLNPQYPPEQVIPAGSQLKLPNDARVGQ